MNGFIRSIDKGSYNYLWPVRDGQVAPQQFFKLPDTGQSTCYDSSGNVISCAGTGQDGAYPINPISLTDNGNGTVTDNNTRLMWQQQDDGNTYNWDQATGTYDMFNNPNSQNVCGSLNLGGYTDWRLPTKKELMSIVDYSIQYPGPTINPIFTNTKQSFYWSSTTAYSIDPDFTWYVVFSHGDVGAHYKSNAFYVRCVRGGTSQISSFTDNGNGTVTDIKTGLVWQQGEPGYMTWPDALNYCENLELPSGSSQSDWRLPNIKELESITNNTLFDPVNHPLAIDTNAFPNAVAALYWSSTTNAYEPYLAWIVDVTYGSVYPYSKNVSSVYVRCVRDGGTTEKVIIPYQSTDYKYQIYSLGEVPANFGALDFDDSQFQLGNAAFGSGGSCPLQTTVKTQWPVNTEIALRKSFPLPSGASNLRVLAAVDNDVQVLINGIDISNGLMTHDGCPTLSDFLFQAPNSILQSGENLLAVRVRDRGDESFVDVQVVVDMLPPPPACTYTYSDWGDCQPDNTETRTVLAAIPDGCIGTPVLSESCTYIPYGNLEVLPSSSYFDFGGVEVGDSRPQLFTLENKGNADLNITGISLSDNENFSLDINGGANPCAATNRSLSPKTSCTITVSFRPSEGRVFDTTLTIASNDPNSPMSIAINGQGLKSSLDISIPTVFGGVDLNETSEQTATIRNTGNTTVNISDITLTNVENFSLQDSAYSCRTTLNPGDTCSFEISFHPKSDGILTAFLAISSNLPNTPYLEFELSGRGLISVDHYTKLFEDVSLFGYFMECGNGITNENRIPLILIHGIHGTENLSGSDAAEYWSKFGESFCSKRDLKNKYKLYFFSYTSDKHFVREIGQSLRNTLDDFIRQGKIRDGEFVILAHSMGGLVARSYMQEHSHAFGNFINKRGWERTTLITLATPHHGSPGQNETAALENYFTPGWHVVFSSSQLFYNLTSATPGSKWNVTLNSDQPNRKDLRWDSMLYPDVGSDTNYWLWGLNDGLTPEMANKIIAYFGYIDPQRPDRVKYEKLPIMLKIMQPSENCYFVLPEVACYDDHQKLTVASALMNAGLKRLFPKNDGMVPAQSGKLEGKQLRKVVECFDYDHLDMLMKLSEKGKKCNSGKTLFQYIKEDLFGL